MHIRITSDANDESGVGEVVDELSGPTRRHFSPKDYGSGLIGVVVVLMCRDPSLNFKRRVRFARKEKKLYMDVMLDLAYLVNVDHENRKKTIIERVLSEVPTTLHKYALKEFDETRFVQDLDSWFAECSAESHRIH